MTPSAAISQFHTAQASPIQARPAENASSGTSTGTSTITANDFLTLLVTEMKNQDPTNSTDPNQYINQLVSVNSLEQLIEINQTLSGARPSGSAPESGNAAMLTPSAGQSFSNTSMVHSAGVQSVTSGNLGLPRPNPAAQQIARALSPHPRA